MDLTDIYRTFHSAASEYRFFPSVHETCFKIDHMIDHETNLSKFKKIEIIANIFSDHNGMKFEINKRTMRRSTNM